MSFLKSIWKNSSKHKKLSEELALKNAKEAEVQQLDAPEDKEKDKDIMMFKLKYLGSTVVEKVVGENINPEAVKNVIKVAKASGKKIPRVNVAISLKGINVTDNKGNDMFEVSIYRISNCSTDKQHRQVFSFISIDPNETMECHAFWCSKRKMAEMVALTVAHAFSTAYESWRLLPNVSEFEKNGGLVQSENMKNTLNTMKNNLMENDVMDKSENEQIIEEKLIDFDDDPATEVGINISYTISSTSFDAKNQWVCFEDDFVNSFRNDLQGDVQNDIQNAFKCDFQNDFKCDFKNNFHDNIQSSFQNSIHSHVQNNFQNDAQRWNNANKVDLFFS